jgi:hypothetical protein
MPNWCSNSVTFTHKDPQMIERVRVAVEDSKALFNEFVPCPEELANTEASFVETDESKARVEKYGYANWYEFNIGAWGTKWEADWDNALYDLTDNSIMLNFDTAWSPPVPFYEKMEALGFVVEAKYYEPGMGFVGEYVTDAGDSYFDIPGSSDAVVELIPEHLDQWFGISEYMAEWESEQEYEENA